MSFFKLRLGWALGLAAGLWLAPSARAQPADNSDGGQGSEASEGSEASDGSEGGSDPGDEAAPSAPAPPSLGEDAEARALFEAGRAAYSDGRFEDALGHFRRAHELSDRPRLLFNIANTAERLRRDEQALDAYERYLEQVPDAENRAFVEERITALRDTSSGGSDAASTGAGGGSGGGAYGDGAAAGTGDADASWLSRRPIIGPAILGGVGIVGLGVMIGSFAAEGCNVRVGNECLAGKRVAAGPTAVYGLIGAASLVGGALWFTLGERGDGLLGARDARDGETRIGVGPRGVWLRGSF